jgi:hypothetical protein
MIAYLRQQRDDELEEARYALKRYAQLGMDVWAEEALRSVANAKEHHVAMMRRVRMGIRRSA